MITVTRRYFNGNTYVTVHSKTRRNPWRAIGTNQGTRGIRAGLKVNLYPSANWRYSH